MWSNRALYHGRPDADRTHCEDGSSWRTSGLIGGSYIIKNRSDRGTMLMAASSFYLCLHCNFQKCSVHVHFELVSSVT